MLTLDAAGLVHCCVQETTGETRILIEWERGVYVLTELNQLVISVGQGRVDDLRCRGSLRLGWDVVFSIGPGIPYLHNYAKPVA